MATGGAGGWYGACIAWQTVNQELVSRAQAGDTVALAELTAQMMPLLRRFALRLCKHPDAAEDVTQDALLAFASKLGDFEGRAALSTWAFTLARTACARTRRGQKNAPGVPLEGLADPPTDEASPEDAAVDRESVRLVGEAIEGLPPDYQAVLKLRDLDGLDTQEACAQLGLSPEALKSRLHRARAALAERLLVLLKPARPGQG